MKKYKASFIILIFSVSFLFTAGYFRFFTRSVTVDKIRASFDKDGKYSRISISYPQNETLFPPEIIAPHFRWKDDGNDSNTWLIHFDFHDDMSPIYAIIQKQEWQPADDEWEIIKKQSLENPVHVSLFGLNSKKPQHILSKGDFYFTTSKDSVGAPIFYREVNLPFEHAVKDPTKILWRFGSISDKKQPPIVLENMPVCGNCHSFSQTGREMGMDVDYANDKGSYAFTTVQSSISLCEENIITWSDYKRDDRENTFGLLSQVSPNGRYVVSTVKDRSVFVAKPDLTFSQLFFPIKGILAIYDSETEEFHALPGADNAQYVQSNASWSPDGKHIVFAGSEAYKLKNLDDNDKVLLTTEECEEFLKGEKEFLYDLYRIPFNNGKGGTPEPLRGASSNGKSNFFAKYSPDGKWLVFCKAKSYMLLQPDSELYIIPAEGGEARRMTCNTNRMNSWHSWSPNSKWLVFSSKQNSAYTQLFLTHIDSNGISSPPVLLEQFTNKNMAANIPEFVNTKAAAIQHIQKDFITDNSYLRAGNEALISKDFLLAEEKYKKALQLNANNLEAHIQLAIALTAQKKCEEAELICKKAIQIDSTNGKVYFQLGEALYLSGKFTESIESLNRAVKYDAQFPTTRFVLGQAKEKQGQYSEAIRHYKDFIRLYPASFKGYFCLIELLLKREDTGQALKFAVKAESLQKENAGFLLGNLFTKYGLLNHANTFYQNAIKVEPDNPEPMCNLAANLFKQGDHKNAVMWYNKALHLKDDVLPGLIGLSSILIMSPDATLRDGQKAVEYLEKACHMTNYNSEVPLNLLAAAYAECGLYSKAVATAERALAIAQSKQRTEMCQQIKNQIELYKKRVL